MWSHYSDSHKGICIGFNWNKLFFIFNHTPIHAEKVIYPKNNQYPEWNPFVEDSQIIDKMFFSKSLDWEYEDEWRIVLPENGGISRKFDHNAIVSVFLGCQISKNHKEDIVDWCLRREQKPRIYQTAKSESSYSLQTEEIIYNK